MFEVGFSELLLISVIALVVLGPERLPKLVGQVGRWVGKARSMARQFREQLESEVNLEDLTRTPPGSASGQNTPGYPPPGEAPPNDPTMSDSLATAHTETAGNPYQAPAPGAEPGVDPDTIHHPTGDYPYAAQDSHPEGDVYGGTMTAVPEHVTPEESASVAVAPEAEPAAKEERALHDQRV